MSASTAQTLADERELHRLTEHYAHSVDRREPEAVAALFTEDAELALHLPPTNPAAGSPRRSTGRAEIAQAIAAMSRYDATTHLLGQRTFDVDGDEAIGETYCLAYHVTRNHGRARNVVLSIRYLDTCVRQDGRWLFRHRRVMVDWMEDVGPRRLPV